MKQSLSLLLAVVFLSPSLAFAADPATPDDAPRANPEAVALQPAEPPQIHAPTYVYAASGVFLVGALGFSFYANGQTHRADTLVSATAAHDEFLAARRSAATANMLYAVAGLTLAYGLVLQFFPDSVAHNTDLMFHF